MTGLNPRSCAASSMAGCGDGRRRASGVSIRVRARLHRWRRGIHFRARLPRVSIRVRARLHRWRQLAILDEDWRPKSQSAFVRGFIDGACDLAFHARYARVSIRVRARLHRWQGISLDQRLLAEVSIRVRARLHRWRPRARSPSGSGARSQSAFVRGFIDGRKLFRARG